MTTLIYQLLLPPLTLLLIQLLSEGEQLYNQEFLFVDFKIT